MPKMSTPQLLMIEDDLRLAQMVSEYLTQSGMAVTHAGDGASGMAALQDKAPDLVKTLDEKFAAVDAAMAKHRAGDGWKLHNELSAAELKELSDVINALAEPVSRVAATISGK